MEATQENRAKVWREWQDHCRSYQVDPYLDGCDFDTVARVALNYGGRLRQGRRGRPVAAGTVAQDLGHLATQIGLDRGTRPLHQPFSEHYIVPIQHMLAGFKNFDPAVEKKLACHPDVPAFACNWAYREGTGAQQRAIGDLVVIAFYFLLRVGEYTTKTRRGKKKTRTRQFRLKDITFFVRNAAGEMVPLPRRASAKEIMRAEAATLRISNQKNGHAGACVHHSAIPGAGIVCPVKALARRFVHIREHTRSNEAFVCSYWDEVGRGDVTDGAIRYAVKFAAAMLGCPARGIPIDRVDTHSLRSGGACAMKLSGHSDTEIKKQGRWAPDLTSFLEYIQQQLSTFAAGMATKMSRIARFTNVESSTTKDDWRESTIF